MPTINDQVIPYPSAGLEVLPVRAGAVTVGAVPNEAVAINLTSDVQITLTPPRAGYRKLDIILRQGGLGGRTVTWMTPINWLSLPAAAAPGPNARRRVSLIWDTGAWYEDEHAATDGGADQPTDRINVRSHGALPGGPDCTTAFVNARAESLSTGLPMYIPSGVWMLSSFPVATRLAVEGDPNGTILRQIAGTDGPLVTTPDFDDLHLSNSDAGAHFWRLQDVVLDGNGPNQSTANNGLEAYGMGFQLINVDISNCSGIGLVSDYGPAPISNHAVPPLQPPLSLDARVVNLRVAECDGGAIDWNGPHDSHWNTVQTALHDSAECEWNVRVTGYGLDAANFHIWGKAPERALLVEAEGASFVGGQIEGARVAQLSMRAPRLRIDDVMIYGLSYDPSVGVEVGGTGRPCSASTFSGIVFECREAFLNFINDAGGSIFEVAALGPATAAVLGTRSAQTELHLNTPYDNVAQSARVVAVAGGRLGFFGATGTTKPTVSGSRGSGAALTSLLSSLAGMGLITDGTSA